MKCLSRANPIITANLLKKPGIIIGLKDFLGKSELIHAVEKNFYDGAKLVIEAA